MHYHAVGLDQNSTQKIEVPLLLKELKLLMKVLKSIMILYLFKITPRGFILDKIYLKKQILSEQTKILLQLAQSKGIQKQAIIHGEPTMTKHLLMHVIIIMKNMVYQKVMTDMFHLKC